MRHHADHCACRPCQERRSEVARTIGALFAYATLTMIVVHGLMAAMSSILSAGLP